MRGSAPATRAQAPRRALADSRSSRGLRCARFTPALALAPGTPRLRFGPLSAGASAAPRRPERGEGWCGGSSRSKVGAGTGLTGTDLRSGGSGGSGGSRGSRRARGVCAARKSAGKDEDLGARGGVTRRLGWRNGWERREVRTGNPGTGNGCSQCSVLRRAVLLCQKRERKCVGCALAAVLLLQKGEYKCEGPHRLGARKPRSGANACPRNAAAALRPAFSGPPLRRADRKGRRVWCGGFLET